MIFSCLPLNLKHMFLIVALFVTSSLTLTNSESESSITNHTNNLHHSDKFFFKLSSSAKYVIIGDTVRFDVEVG